MDLPTELRVEVLRCVLRSEKDFEFWTEKKGEAYDTVVQRRRDATQYVRLTTGPRAEFPLQLLRVCKQLNEEAAEIFYGENIFRFIGRGGWVVALAFMNKIGRQHWRFLKHLVLPVPIPTQGKAFDCTAWQYHVYRPAHHDALEELLSINQKEYWIELLQEIGLRVPRQLPGNLGAFVRYPWLSFKIVCDLLAQAQRLRNLDLVITDGYYPMGNGMWTKNPVRQSRYWDRLESFEEQMPNLTISLIRFAVGEYDPLGQLHHDGHPNARRLFTETVRVGWNIYATVRRDDFQFDLWPEDEKWIRATKFEDEGGNILEWVDPGPEVVVEEEEEETQQGDQNGDQNGQ